jgi:hypothetical protein
MYMATNDLDQSIPIKSWKYKIEQTSKGARITVHGDEMTGVVNDYYELRNRLETAGFKIAPED